MTKYLETLFRHRLRFALLFFILPAELAVACIFLFPHRTVSSSMWVDTPAYISISPSIQGWNQYLTPSQNTVDAMNQLRSTDAFNSALAAKLDDELAFRSPSERDSIFSTIQTDMVVVSNGSHLVVITYTCPREPLCSQVVSQAEAIYHQWVSDQQTAQAKVAIDFYTGQLGDAQKKLVSDSGALSAYLTSHPSVKPGDASVNPELDSLFRNVNDDQLQVAAMQQKLDDTRLTDAAVGQTDNTVLRVVDPPRASGGQLASLPKKQMLFGAGAGLAVALGVLVFMAWSDRTARDPKEIEAIVRLPIVVMIPQLPMHGSADA